MQAKRNMITPFARKTALLAVELRRDRRRRPAMQAALQTIADEVKPKITPTPEPSPRPYMAARSAAGRARLGLIGLLAKRGC